jgi:hypothetical protein
VVPAITPMVVIAALIGVVAKLFEYGLLGNQPNPSFFQMSFVPFTALGIAISSWLP